MYLLDLTDSIGSTIGILKKTAFEGEHRESTPPQINEKDEH
jgi:hypothetical protein